MRNNHKNVAFEARMRFSKNVPEINSARNFTPFHPKSAPKMQHVITHKSLGVSTLQSKPLWRKLNLTDIFQRRPLHDHTPLYIGGIVRLHEIYPELMKDRFADSRLPSPVQLALMKKQKNIILELIDWLLMARYIIE